MLKKIRITLAILMGLLITFFFIDFAGILPSQFHFLAKIQFIPALLSHSIGILAVLLILTFLFGRIYCSVICPMGIFQDVANRLSQITSKKKKKFHFQKNRKILRPTIVGLLVLACLFNFTVLLGILDPYSAYGRMAVNLLKPIYLTGNNVLTAIFTNFDNYTFYKTSIAVRSIASLAIAAITFLAIGFLGWKYGRTYCNTICPVGTILGYISKYSFFKINIDVEKCNHCGLCETKCKAMCINSKEQYIDHGRCVDCFNCIENCKKGALRFSPINRKKSSKPIASQSSTIDSGKRKFIATIVSTAAITPSLMAQETNEAHLKSYKRQYAICPPGAISADHLLDHCTSCQLCISKCPSNVLKPAFLEYGIGGMMQPTMSFEKGFCNYDCTTCSDVCPNEAIKPLSMEEKHLTQVGRVVFVEENCIVHRLETNCGACSEHCPTQAVSMVPYKNGLTIPHTNPDICVGCGGCEYVCPVRPFKAIYIEGNEIQLQAQAFKEEEQKEIEINDFGF